MRLSRAKNFAAAVFIIFCSILVFPFKSSAQKSELPITTSSKDALNLFIKGRVFLEFIDYAKSAKYLEQAIEKDNNFALAHLYRYRTNIGSLKEYYEYLNKAVKLADKVSEGEKYYILSFKAESEGDGTKRKEYLEKLLKLYPADRRIQYEIGKYYHYDERDFAAALKYFNKVIELDDEFAPVYNNIGYCNIWLGRLEEAEKAFKKQIELVPDLPNPRDSYAEILLKLGKYDESIEQYKAAYEKDNSFIFALEGVGDNYVKKGEFEKARKYYRKRFDKALVVGGKFSALNNIADSYIYEGKINEALKVYKEYRGLAAENKRLGAEINSYQNEGFILTDAGRPAEGLASFQKAAKLINLPDTPESVQNYNTPLNMLYECYALLKNKDMEKAADLMIKCEQIMENKYRSRDIKWLNYLKALENYQLGRYEDALEFYLKSWTDLSYVMYDMVLNYEKLGNKKKTVELLKKLKNWSGSEEGYPMVLYRMNYIDKR